MDTWIQNGDFAMDALGRPIAVDADAELLQQVKLRLLIPKGSFCYDSELGSRLYTLKGNSYPERQALTLAAEALREIPGITPVAAEIVPVGNLNIRLRLFLDANGTRRQTEVEL